MPDPDTRPSAQPDPEAADATTAEDAPAEDAAGSGAVEPPLNRAARRGRQQEKPQPGHVGPQGGRARAGHAPRSYTKRRSG